MLALGAAVAACSPPPEVEPPKPAVVRRATCDQPVGGPMPLPTDSSVEAQEGYDAQLASLDLQGLPEELDISTLLPLFRGVVAYMLERDPETLGPTLNRDELMKIEPMGKAVLGAFAMARLNQQEELDVIFLRRGLHRFYSCARQFPLTLAEFKTAYGDFSQHEVTLIDPSRPKGGPRRLIANPADQIWVAETVVDGQVRETEIVMGGRRADSAIDFVVYDHDGNLMDRSEFSTTNGGTRVAAAPYGCIACHFERSTFKVNVVFPIMGSTDDAP